MRFWCRCCSLSFRSCRLPASLLWASSSWSWVCRLSSSTGRLGSPAVEADISCHDWPEILQTERQPKLSRSLNYPWSCRVLSQSQIGKFGSTKRRICDEPSPATQKNERKRSVMWWGRKKKKSPRNGGKSTEKEQLCSDWITPMSHLSARLIGSMCRNVKDSKKKKKMNANSMTQMEIQF